MDSATLVTGAAVVLAGSLAIYQFGKPKPLPLIPHNKLHWLKGDIPFLVKMEKENSGFSYAFDDTATRLGPVSQVCEPSLVQVPVVVADIACSSSLDSEHLGLLNSSASGRSSLFSPCVKPSAR